MNSEKIKINFKNLTKNIVNDPKVAILDVSSSILSLVPIKITVTIGIKKIIAM